MLHDQCISVTELRTKTKTCLEGLKKEPKYIFINNHPVAVLVDVVVFEENFSTPHLAELQKNEVSPAFKRQAARAKKTKSSQLLDL